MTMHTPDTKGLVVLDYDGTAAEEGGRVAPSVFAGIEALWEAGIPTSVITARPYQRLAAVCGGEAYVNKLVPPHYPLATERGGRIVNSARDANLLYEPLGADELDAIADVDTTDVDFVGFCPKELQGPSYIWSDNTSRYDELSSRFGRDAIVLTSGRPGLRRVMKAARPCLVTVKFGSSEPDRTTLEGDLNISWEKATAAIVAAGVDKYFALDALSTATGVPIEAVTYAGNDASDVAVLRRPELRERIFVGGNAVVGMAEPVTRIATPHDLGTYLGRLAAVSGDPSGRQKV